MKKIKKLNKQMDYTSGLFNSRNEQVLAKAINIVFSKLDEQAGTINELIEIIELQNKLK